MNVYEVLQNPCICEKLCKAIHSRVLLDAPRCAPLFNKQHNRHAVFATSTALTMEEKEAAEVRQMEGV